MMADAVAAKSETLSVGAFLALLSGLVGIVTTFLQRNKIKATAKAEGKKEAMEATMTINGQPIGVQEVKPLATKGELDEMEDRIEGRIRELKESQDSRLTKIEQAQVHERDNAQTELGKIHARLDKVMENQATSRGELTQISLNVQRLLNRRDH